MNEDETRHPVATDRAETRQDVVFQDAPANKSTFSKELVFQRKAHGISQEEAAKAAQFSTRQIQRWESGRIMPSKSVQSAILLAIQTAYGKPSRAIHAEAKRHHLHWEAGRGWSTRFTIDLGPKRVGKRIRIRLRTTVLDEAKARMDLLIAGYRKLGLTIHFRIQKRGDQREASPGKRGRE